MALLLRNGRLSQQVLSRGRATGNLETSLPPNTGTAAVNSFDEINHVVERDSRFTTAEFMEPIYKSFGEIGLDPCGHARSPVKAHRRILLSEGGDGLTDPWSGDTAYINPPFSQFAKWLPRADKEWRAGNVKTVICLAPTSTDLIYFQDVMSFDADIFLIRGRVKFICPGDVVRSTRYPLMLVTLGTTAEQRARYADLVRGFWVRRLDTRA